jgi:hypothetical protein
MSWKGYERKRPWRILRHYPDIWLEELKTPPKISVRISGLRAEI